MTELQTPGQLLSAAREARSLTQQEVAKRMRLPTQTICDIDRDALAELGARTYVRGYLTAYARIVGVSEEQILTSLNKSGVTLETPGTRPVIVEGAPITNVTRQSGRFHFQPSYFVGIGVLAVVAVVAIALWSGKKENDVTPVVVHQVKKHDTFAALSSFNNTSTDNTNSNTLVPTDNTLQDVTVVSNAAPTTKTSNTVSPLTPVHHAKHLTAHNGFTQPINGLRPTYTLSPVANDTKTQNS